MVPKINHLEQDISGRSTPYAGEVLAEQLLWLIGLRWIAALGILGAALAGHYIFSVLGNPVPIYGCAVLLLLCNTVYYYVATHNTAQNLRKNTILGVVQVELDLFIVTMVLYFSGGLVNPFYLFYLFHVIIAVIILPLSLSVGVGFTAIGLYGVLAVNELTQGQWLGYHALELSRAGSPWRSPVYIFAAFVAFSGTVILAQYLTRIITNRMSKKEHEAAHNYDVLKAVICAMNEGLIYVDQQGQVALCNPSAQSWKNESGPSDALSCEAFPPALSDHIRHMIEHGLASSDKQLVEFKTEKSDPRYIEAKGSSVVGLDGNPIGHVVVGRDLTEHKKLEQELTKQTEQVTDINEMLKMSRIEMAQRERMVAIGQMAAGIAHEIGNPLASLSSVAQYLARKVQASEYKEQLLVIQSHVNRISNILKRMLTFSRPATAEYRWSDIDIIIENALLLVKFDKRMHSVTIQNELNGDLPTVWLNPQSFEQVLLNILINAMDAMCAKSETEQNSLRITRHSDGEVVEIGIHDTGIGMDQDVADRAFESFFTTKEIGKGTGLGLFISHNLITELGGTIRIESERGRGTCVSIQIPVRAQADLFMNQRPDDAENKESARTPEAVYNDYDKRHTNP
jgi:signal transduction histidine kinase